MEQHGTQKTPGVVRLSASNITFLVLCAYLAIIALCYISWLPSGLNSLLLYGFVLMAALTICFRGRLLLAYHTVWYALFVAVCAVSCLYSANNAVSAAKVSELLKILIFSMMFMAICNSKKRIQMAMFVITASITILFFHLFTTGQLDVDERLGQSLTGNANTFASIFMIGAFCSAYFVYFSEKKAYRILALIVFLLQLYALALAGSRKFFLMPVFLLGFLKVFSTDKKGRRFLFRNLIVATAVIALALWAVMNVDFLYDSIGHRMEGMLAAFTGEGEVDTSTRIRQELIEKGIELWKEAPLLGHGIDVYKVISGTGNYAHNNYAELLCDVGLVGAMTYYCFFLYLAWKLIKNKQMGMRRWYWTICLGCIMVFDYGAVSYNMYLIQIMLLLANCALHIEGHAEQTVRKEAVDGE